MAFTSSGIRRALVLGLLVCTACGTRVDNDPGAALAPAVSAPTTVGGADAGGATKAPSGAAPEAPAAAPVNPARAGSPKTGAGQAVPAKARSGAAPSRPDPAGPRPVGQGSSGAGGAAPASPGKASGEPATAGSLPAPPSSSSPVILASVGTYSGPAASSVKPNLDGAQIWVKDVNSRGGLRGHPVRLLVYDDAGDPARHRAQLQEAIEQRKVVAFFANGEAITGASSSDYVASKRVPVIGADGGEEHAYTNPMYFMPHAVGLALDRTFLLSAAEQVVPTGKTKLATVMCVEAQACADTSKIFADEAGKHGFQLVSQARASIAQPDFTAECLAARNAGADTFFVMLDSNSISRVATACVRQGYRPQFTTGASIVVDRFKEDPNLEGLVAGSTVFPYFQTGTPATDEFHRAFKSHGGGLALGVGMAQGWTDGKLLERASGNLTEPPSSESILAGLWSVSNDTLGGLTYPLTFVKDQPAARKVCWFNVTIKDHDWVSPDRYALRCA